MFNISAISHSTFAWYKPYLHHRLWRWRFLLASLPVNSNWVKEQPPNQWRPMSDPRRNAYTAEHQRSHAKKTTLLSVSQSAVTDADIPPDWIKTLTLKRRVICLLPWRVLVVLTRTHWQLIALSWTQSLMVACGQPVPYNMVLSHRSITSLLSKQQDTEKKCCVWVFENQWKRFYENTAIMQQPHYWYSCC